MNRRTWFGISMGTLTRHIVFGQEAKSSVSKAQPTIFSIRSLAPASMSDTLNVQDIIVAKDHVYALCASGASPHMAVIQFSSSGHLERIIKLPAGTHTSIRVDDDGVIYLHRLDRYLSHERYGVYSLAPNLEAPPLEWIGSAPGSSVGPSDLSIIDNHYYSRITNSVLEIDSIREAHSAAESSPISLPGIRRAHIERLPSGSFLVVNKITTEVVRIAPGGTIEDRYLLRVGLKEGANPANSGLALPVVGVSGDEVLCLKAPFLRDSATLYHLRSDGEIASSRDLHLPSFLPGIPVKILSHSQQRFSIAFSDGALNMFTAA